LETLSDGVLAIIITIMVLELRVLPGAELSALVPLIPKFLSYALSFVYIGIYLNNHTITCFKRSSALMGAYCGPICICYSGCR